MRSLYRALILAAVVWAIAFAGQAAVAQNSVIEGYPVIESFSPQAWERSSRAAPKDMEWWQDAKFGVLIQWGPVVLTGERGLLVARREPRARGRELSECRNPARNRPHPRQRGIR